MTTGTSKKKFGPGIYTAIVKDNVDKMGMGRVRVYIPMFGGDPTDETNWYTASPVSPYAGATDPYDNKKGSKKDIESQDSYGMWATGYNLENELIVTFLNGNPSGAVILGGVFGQNMTHAIAGYPSAKSHQGTTRSVHPPTVEYNKQDNEINPRAPIRPQRDLTTRQLKKQGLYRDMQRGQMSTSPHRDEVPQFTSIKTPRGNVMVMDDGQMASQAGAGIAERDYSRASSAQGFLRLRSSNGAQIYVNDNCGYVYMNSADGNSFMQIADNAISLYTANILSTRAKSSFSVRVDGNYNLEVLGSTRMKSVGQFTTNVGGSTNIVDNGEGIKLQAAASYDVKAGNGLAKQSEGIFSQMAGGSIIESSGGVLRENSGGVEAIPEPIEVTTGTASDRESSGCNGQKEADSSLPAGGLVTHEPTGTHSGACGFDSSPPTQNCDPYGQQVLGDGTYSDYPANPPDECDGGGGTGGGGGGGGGGSEEDEGGGSEDDKGGGDDTDTDDGSDQDKEIEYDDSDIVEIIDSGPGWVKVRLADGSIVTRKGARNWRNNNPGNIEYGDFAKRMGAIGSDGRFAIFPDYETGLAAQEYLLFNSPGYRDLTIGGAINRYAPPSENNTQAYIRAITNGLGLPANTKLSDLTPGQRRRMLEIMHDVEGWKVGKIYS